MNDVLCNTVARDPMPCRVIGVLDDGAASLASPALAHLRAAQLVIGAPRTLGLFEDEIAPDAERHVLGALPELVERIRLAREANQAVVLLATGDPLCHGIAAYLAAQLCLQAIEVLPNVSTLQLACARVGLPWADARIVSIHARDAGEWQCGAAPGHGLYELAQALRRHDRLLVLTSPANTPDRVARLLMAEGLAEDFELAVAERLNQAGERVLADLRPADAASMQFADPNVLLLWRVRERRQPVRFGLMDATYAQRQPEKGLITKQEVRAVSLARMQLRADSRVWDIGAGSGSVGLEAARLCPQGHVWAIEKNADDFAIAGRNRAAFGLSNHTLVHGKAPEGLDLWPDPDAVFIGGSGGELAGLIKLCLKRLRTEGWLVMNFVTLENLATATAALEEAGAQWDVLQLQAARSKPILAMHRMAAENPVWIVCARQGNAQMNKEMMDGE
ncbi:precorrin-6y C5,15-methyltransferase (decarboxylating) subunit CbiE [Uliginosibacterium sp. TH139]|uniref:precorrin-6y C5,15-methyltransferase (decarboxylating) subunit CbiE n=1 Tax=Uliginosibacterium sp. TH139 TaxID=2067453 RepID=UPI000C7C9400|nr:precorrin-6y C5,15-methyltransferase (decarboxylating) subunit CbiE [Uliginosibacterium sp. TH139]PLK47763.1 cobalamin biosynthesis bifunctional protein CbiET [Uliginosibacterium sp. TH139]